MFIYFKHSRLYELHLPVHQLINFFANFVTGIASIMDIALSNWSFEFITVSL